tara:strand:- start:188 stop:439 length:252 start_codon:yes stop_codon:yes gene_type:complete
MTQQFKWSVRYIPIQFNRVRADGNELPDSNNYFKILRKREKSMLHNNIDTTQHKKTTPPPPAKQNNSFTKRTVQPLFQIKKNT